MSEAVYESYFCIENPSRHKGGPQSTEVRREKENRERKYDWDVSKIPNDVIEHVIMRYLEVEVKDQKEFDLFGFFKNDPSRRIFFVFKSLFLDFPNKNFQCESIIDWGAIEHLVLQVNHYIGYEEEELLYRIVKNADFSNLLSFDYYTDSSCFKKLMDTPFCVFQNKSFDELNTLSIVKASCYNPKHRESTALCNFPKLKKLRVGDCTGLGDRFLQNNSFPLLEVLEAGRSGESGKKWNQMPNIKSLDLVLSSIKEEMFRDPSSFVSFDNLEILKLRVVGDDLFGKPLFNGVGWLKTPNLKELKLEKFDNFDGFFEDQDLSNLKILEIENINGLTGKNWGPMKNLENMVVQECSKFGDYFFQQNEHPNLQVLFLEKVDVKGEGWKPMMKLKLLFTKNCANVNPEFLEKCISKDVCKAFNPKYLYQFQGLKQLRRRRLK